MPKQEAFPEVADTEDQGSSVIVTARDIEMMNTYGDAVNPDNYSNPDFARVAEGEGV